MNNLKRTILFFLSLFIYCSSFAHDPHEAFFRFKQLKNTIEITAEFPWTLRNALLDFSPSLKLATKKEDFEKVFKDYIKQNLQLKNSLGKFMPFINFKELENQDYGHGNNFIFLFEGKNLAEVKNTIMFNISEKQKNYHLIFENQAMNKYETNKQKTKFFIDKDDSINFWYLMLFIPMILIIINFKKIKGYLQKIRLNSYGTSI